MSNQFDDYEHSPEHDPGYWDDGIPLPDSDGIRETLAQFLAYEYNDDVQSTAEPEEIINRDIEIPDDIGPWYWRC